MRRSLFYLLEYTVFGLILKSVDGRSTDIIGGSLYPISDEMNEVAKKDCTRGAQASWILLRSIDNRPHSVDTPHLDPLPCYRHTMTRDFNSDKLASTG